MFLQIKNRIHSEYFSDFLEKKMRIHNLKDAECEVFAVETGVKNYHIFIIVDDSKTTSEHEQEGHMADMLIIDEDAGNNLLVLLGKIDHDYFEELKEKHPLKEPSIGTFVGM